jgi:hypothetical protein
MPSFNDEFLYKKLMFLHNALEDGWIIRKINKSYIFSKKHENKREVLSEDYLEKYIQRQLREH